MSEQPVDTSWSGPVNPGDIPTLRMTGNEQRDTARIATAARELNKAILARSHGRVFMGDMVLQLAVPTSMKLHLLPKDIRPESRLIVHPVHHDTHDRIAMLADHWPNPREKGVRVSEAFLAMAPPVVLALAGFTQAGGTASVSYGSGSQAESPGSFDGSSPAFPGDMTAGPGAAGWDIPDVLSDLVFRAYEALAAGEWEVSWVFGTISVELNPDSCRLVSTVAGAIAGYGGKKFIDTVFSAGPWYMLVIWGLVVADTGYVSYVLSSCAANNHRGRLYWNAFTGIFFAVELPEEGTPVSAGSETKADVPSLQT